MLHEPSKTRIEDLKHFKEGVLRNLAHLAQEADQLDLACLDCVVTFIEEDDDFKQGTYVPELHLIVRRVDETA